MGYYDDIYKKRVNRFGTDFKSRIQGEREYSFENYLTTSVYQISISYDGQTHPVTFEPYKQDQTKTLHYLLTRCSLDIPNGTILNITNDGVTELWMVYYKEDIQSSGYNRYVMVKMTHTITWIGRDKISHTSYAYIFTAQNGALQDASKMSGKQVVYNENDTLIHLLMPANKYIHKDNYFTLTYFAATATEAAFVEGYRVTGYDLVSSNGVEYISADPMYIKDETPAPQKPSGDTSNNYYWIEMGE